MKRMTDFQEGLLKIMQLPDAIDVVVSTRKRRERTSLGYVPVEHDKRKDKEGPVAIYFRERFKWKDSISLKAMGKELWSAYQSLRYYYKKYGRLPEGDL